MVYNEGMDQWLLAVTSDPAAKGSAKDLEVAGAGLVHCHFSLPPSFLTMCSSERCLSLASPWYIDHLNQLCTYVTIIMYVFSVFVWSDVYVCGVCDAVCVCVCLCWRITVLCTHNSGNV